MLVIVFSGVLISSCTGSLKSSWDNFTAFYNTFYNAKQSYQKGIDEVKKQKVQINPERPIRIYQTPITVSPENFDKAISKSADVLRYHPKSKWADNALFVIGRSYYYEAKYYSAEQKFQELFNLTKSNVMQQNAIFWRGRVMLEMNRIDEGINYLNRELNSVDYKWNKNIRAETELLLADFYVTKENWASAQSYIPKAIHNIKDRELKARAYFLEGQLLEQTGKLKAAYNSYAHVKDTHPVYELVYAALKKQAEVAREEGDFKRALKIFTTMSNDDKNFDTLPELKYEIARTLEVMGNYREAELTYNEVLHHSIKNPNQETKVKSYYGLGDIYRDYYKNYRKAAAYYDSSASQVSDKRKLPINFNASDLAQSFGEYAKLSNEVRNMDSLLWLGGLNSTELDSVIAVIRKRKLEELKTQLKAQQSGKNTLVNINAAQNAQQNGQAQNGFLNYRSQELVMEGSQAFKAIWGDRPLVDNWRRMEAINQLNAQSTQDTEIVAVKKGSDEDLQRQIKIDLSQVPFSSEAKEKMKSEIAMREYEIGNVFFLSLNMPDSASKYYRKIIANYRETDLAPQAMYSLSELNYIQNDSVKAQQWADSVMINFPETIYAERLNNRYGANTSGNTDMNAIMPTLNDSLQYQYYSLLDSLKYFNYVQGAEKMRSFGLNHSISKLAPDAMLNSARLYIQAAKQNPDFKSQLDQWTILHKSWKNEEDSLKVLKDTARVRLSDPKLSKDEKARWRSISDSTLGQPDFSKVFPYNGAYWDSARVVLKQLISYFPNYTKKNAANDIYQELTKPSSEADKKR